MGVLTFDGSLADQVSGSIALKSGASRDSIAQCGMTRVKGSDRGERNTYRPFSLSLSPMFLESFLNSRVDLALSVSTTRF